MNAADERCPICSAIPNWNLLYRKAAALRAVRREADGLPPDPKDPPVVWRNVYRHEQGRPCARFNLAYHFAPLALADQARNGPDSGAKVHRHLAGKREAHE